MPAGWFADGCLVLSQPAVKMMLPHHCSCLKGKDCCWDWLALQKCLFQLELGAQLVQSWHEGGHSCTIVCCQPDKAKQRLIVESQHQVQIYAQFTAAKLPAMQIEITF